MSFAVINMAWVNDTNKSLSFQSQGEPQHGTNPKPSTNPMTAVGTATNTSTVSASSNSSLSGPGPQGTYQWEIVGSNPTAFINVQYNHPFGHGTTVVDIQCPAGYQVAACDQGPAGSISLGSNCASLQNHDNAFVQITVSET